MIERTACQSIIEKLVADHKEHACPYLTLVGEFCEVDVQLLVFLLQFGEVGLQPGVLQVGLVQLALQQLVVHCQRLIVTEKQPVCAVEPLNEKAQ